jgi:hypothetical protein
VQQLQYKLSWRALKPGDTWCDIKQQRAA